MSTPRLENLVARSKAGNKQAFADLMDMTLPTMRNIAYSFLQPEDVEDGLQEVRAHLWAHIGQYERQGDGNFTAWLAIVTRHQMIDILRQQRAIARHELQGADLDRLLNSEPVPDARIEKLRDGIGLLTERERAMVVKHYLLGYRYAEIAAQDCISEGTVRTHLQRARAKLKIYITTED